jgi:hypothetical protein
VRANGYLLCLSRRSALTQCNDVILPVAVARGPSLKQRPFHQTRCAQPNAPTTHKICNKQPRPLARACLIFGELPIGWVGAGGVWKSADQRISGSAVDGAPTEEPRPDARNARAIGVSRVPCSCLCVETPVVTHRCFALPRSSILCGCINFPGKQVFAVWGRYPTACCTVYVKKKLEVYWGLVDKTSPAFEVRNSGVPAVVR